MQEFIEFEPRPKLMFHHGRKLDYCQAGVIKPPSFDELGYKDPGDKVEMAYKWMEKTLGFVPVYFSVGIFDEAKRFSGYPINDVLFSFSKIEGVFSDYRVWESVMFGGMDPEEVRQSLFAPERNQEEWLKKSLKDPGSVQMMAPVIDLSSATTITVPSEFQKKILSERGFNPGRIQIRKH